ncbi:MAG TPA: sulfotransferase, partial [Rhizomicrobium sp.]|nr:sulfotransferase [Rhizomicrobium sp.]
MSLSEFANIDPFEAALRRLRSERPLQNSRLRKLASRAGKHPQADAQVEQELRQHTSEHPDDAQGFWLLAQVVGRLGRPREAAALMARCLELEPGYTLARWNFAKLLFNFSEFPEAVRHLEILLKEEPGNPLFLQLQSEISEALGEGDQTLAIRRRLALEHSGRAESWISYGQALRAEGKREEAIAAYRKALECRPSGDAYWSLANLKTFRFSEADIAAMEQLTNRPEIEPNDRINVFFALGKAYEDRQQYARSWNYYARGNAAIQTYLRTQVTVVSETAARVAADKALFTRAFFESRKDAGCKSRAPIFILGRLRSGTTLLEQILSSHSAIEGTAELPYIRAMAKRLEEVDAPALGTAYPEVLGKLGDEAITALGDEYTERTCVHRKLGRPFFIDKNPTNYFQLG